MLNHLPRTNSSATNDLSGDESFDDATPPPPMDFHFSYSPVKQPATSSPSSNHPSSIPLHLEKERDPTPGLDLNGSPSSVSSSSSATTPPSSLSAGTSRSSAFSLYPKSRQPLGPTQSLERDDELCCRQQCGLVAREGESFWQDGLCSV
jgi:hypothetical protein